MDGCKRRARYRDLVPSLLVFTFAVRTGGFCCAITCSSGSSKSRRWVATFAKKLAAPFRSRTARMFLLPKQFPFSNAGGRVAASTSDSFAITAPGAVVYLLQARTTRERDDWIKAVQGAIKDLEVIFLERVSFLF